MATIQENALLSKVVYLEGGGGFPELPTGWDIITTSGAQGVGGASGYFAAAYRNRETREIVIAHRGTEFAGNDWKQNLQLALQKTPDQYRDAVTFRDSVRALPDAIGFSISHTGHSLGGGLANLMAARNQQETTVGFNSVGVKQVMQALRLDPLLTYSNVLNISAHFDPALLVGERIGTVRKVAVSSLAGVPDFLEPVFAGVAVLKLGPVGKFLAGLYFNSQHKIDNMVDTVRALPADFVGLPQPTAPIAIDLDGNLTGAWASELAAFESALDANAGLREAFSNEANFSYRSIAPGDVRKEQNPEDARSATYSDGDSPSVTAGSDGADSLRGGAGVDIVFADEGADAIDGGSGNDYLLGGAGNDRYVFETGHGADQLIDSDGSGSIVRNRSRLSLGLGQGGTAWTLGGTTYTRSGADLVVTFADSASDSITIRDFDFAKASQDGYLGIRLVGAPAMPSAPVRTFTGDTQDFDGNAGESGIQPVDDGFGNTQRTAQAFADRADVFRGSSANEVERFETFGGNDVVDGDGLASATSSDGGRDLILTSTGQDVVRAGGNDDWVEGGEGADILSGNAGGDVLFGGSAGTISTLDADSLTGLVVAGNTAPDPNAPTPVRDWLAGGEGEDWLVGGAGSDALMGGLGADILLGGQGNDYLFSDADLVAQGANWAATVDASGGRIFTGALGTSYVNTAHGGADLVYAGAGDDEIVSGAGDDAVYGETGADTISLGLGADYASGGEGNDVIFGETLAESALAATDPSLATNDFIDAGAGNDTVFGMAGADVIYGGEGNDILVGDEGSIALAVQGDDYLEGGAGNDTLIGLGGNDTLIGGAGTDVLQGGAGRDIYVFNVGDVTGDEYIDDAPLLADGSDASVIVLGAGITREQIKFRPGSLAIDLGGGARIHVEAFDPQAPSEIPSLDSIRFADGTVMTYQDVLAVGFELEGTEAGETITGTAIKDRIDAKGGNDTLFGLAGDDHLIGGAGNDQLDGGVGDDILNGGAGADTLAGGAGDDTYTVSVGDGTDRIVDDEGVNTVSFGTGIALSSVSLSQYVGDDGGDYLSIAYEGGTLDIQNGALGRVSSFVFENGTKTLAELLATAPALVVRGSEGADAITGSNAADELEGRGGNDVIDGQAGNDLLSGGHGADTLLGGAGNDTLAGGAGNDVLAGGTGADTYRFGIGGGMDRIVEEAGESSVLALDPGLQPADLAADRLGDDLVLHRRGTDEGVTLANYYTQNHAWILRDAQGAEQSLTTFLAGATGNSVDPLSRLRAQAQAQFIGQLTGAGGGGYSLGADGKYRKHTTETHPYDVRSTERVAEVTTTVRTNTTATSLSAGGSYASTLTSRTTTNTPVVVRPRNSAISYAPGAVNGNPQTAPYFYAHGTGFSGFSLPAGATVVQVDSGFWVYPQNTAPAGATGGAGSFTANATRIDERYSEQLTLDQLTAGNGANTITLSGHAIVDAGGGNDTVIGADPQHWSQSRGDAETFYAERPDRHPLETGSNFVYGGAGNDTLLGGRAGDVLWGGEGNDFLNGQGGADVYFVDPQEAGIDLVLDDGAAAQFYGGRVTTGFYNELSGFRDWYYQRIGYTGTGTPPPLPLTNDYAAWEAAYGTGLINPDTVRFAPGLGVEDLAFAWGEAMVGAYRYRTLDLTWESGTKGVRVAIPRGDDSIGSGVERFEFDDGTTLTMRAMIARAPAAPDFEFRNVVDGAGNDTFIGRSLGETWDGGGGADVFEGNEGDDVARGGAGNDTLDGGGIDRLAEYWGFGFAARAPGQGTGNDSLYGGEGNDTLTGGDGSDLLFGEAGNDQFTDIATGDLAEAGSGADSLQYLGGSAFVAGGAGNDSVTWAGDGSLGQAMMFALRRGDGNDTTDVLEGTTISLGGGIALADLTLTRSGSDLLLGLGAGETLRLSGWYAYYPDYVPSTYLQLIGTDARAYSLTAAVQAYDTARAANPSLANWAAAGTLTANEYFASGTQAIGGQLAWDYAHSGTTQLSTPAEARATLGGDFSAPQSFARRLSGTAGNDNLTGTAGADVITGAAGNDAIEGGLGNDTYVFNAGDGIDTLTDAGGTDTLRFGAGIGASDLSLGLGSLLIRVGSGGDAIHLTHFDPQDALGAHDIERFRFADGSELSYAELLSRGFDIEGSAAGETLTGTNVDDRIAGLGGDDLLAGGDGNDTYLYNLGGGADTVTDTGSALDFDVLKLGAGIAPAGVTAGTDGAGGVRLDFAGGGSVRLTGQLEGNGVELVLFDDGTFWTRGTIAALATTPANQVPVVAAPIPDQAATEKLAFSYTVAATAFTDPDAGDLLSLSATRGDGTALPSWLTFDAQTRGFSGTPQQADVGALSVRVTATDPSGAQAQDTFSLTVANVNDAPVFSLTSARVLVNQAVAVTGLLPAIDVDGDALTYSLKDLGTGGGYFTVNGVQKAANQLFTVSGADLANTYYVGGLGAGTEGIYVIVSDGVANTGWKYVSLGSWTHPTNAAPSISLTSTKQLLNEAVAVTTLLPATDADGDPILQYRLYDTGAGGGYFRVNGVQQAANQMITVTGADIANTVYVGGATPGSEAACVFVSDGMTESTLHYITLGSWAHLQNVAPEVAVGSAHVLLNEAVAVTSLIPATDADGDPILRYNLYDEGLGGGYLMVNGVQRTANQLVTVSGADLANTYYVGGSGPGNETVYVNVSDGMTEGAWRGVTLGSWTRPTNAAPNVELSAAGVLLGEAVQVASLLPAIDADGDPILYYKLKDLGTGGGYFTVNGVQQAPNQMFTVSGADLAATLYVGAASAGNEGAFVIASDGMAESALRYVTLHSVGGMRRGGAGDDTLTGDAGTPVLEGQGGGDTLNAGGVNSLLSGGSGNDTLNGAAGSDFLAGGAGNDTLHTGAGNNVIAYNAGDGADTVYSNGATANTLSLGGGIRYADLSLAKSGDDLVLGTGGSGSLTLKNWYAGNAIVLSLQLVLDATADFNAGSQDPLLNKKVQRFDFAGLVSAFDQALAQSPGLTSWAVTNALLQFHLSGADDAAIGGDLAYWYGKNSGFSGIGLTAAQAAIGAQGFGSEAHSLHAFSGLQEGLVKLT